MRADTELAARKAAPDASAPLAKASVETSGYSDTDNVWVITPTVSATVYDEVEGWSVTGRYLLDAVSAASVDVVSAASGKWSENRHVGSGAANFNLRETAVTISGGVSHEPDYLSSAGGVSLSREVLDKNLTPSLAVSVGYDEVGRNGMPRSRWETLYKFGVQPGAAFVVGRSTIASVAFDAMIERGYLAKPYRYVPLFSPRAAAALDPGVSVDEVNETRLDARAIDRVPRSRNRYALTGRIAHRFGRSTVRLNERLYTDSWGLKASTTTFQYYVDLGRRVLIWPQARLHAQQAIDFWELGYQAHVDSSGNLMGVPKYRTGDRELGTMYTVAAGFGVQVRLTERARVPWTLSLVVEASRVRFLDALYISERRSLFSALTLEAGFQ